MAKKVVWSHESDKDLDAIAEYISRDSVFYAASFVEKILDAGHSLNMFHDRGRIVPEIGDRNIREIFIRNYRLIYSIEESRIIILGIIHGKRDFRNIKDRIK
jgi:toxin ParE1/3/4